jgi:hypothetical protein
MPIGSSCRATSAQPELQFGTERKTRLVALGCAWLGAAACLRLWGAAAPAGPATYLPEVIGQLQRRRPSNRTVNIVCHGYSVPAGYFQTPRVDTFHAYPYLLHRSLNKRFSYAVSS